jgi:chromosome segregation ATPase
MFNKNISTDTKIAVLEERLSSYELMLNRIDEAIRIMGNTSQNISKMLAVHEEKIEQSNKADDYISKVIEELRIENKEQHEVVSERIKKIETKLEEVIKFRWILVGIMAVVTFSVSQSNFVVELLKMGNQPTEVIKQK